MTTVTLTPTERFASVNGVRCRCWAGVTMQGVKVFAWVASVRVFTVDPSNVHFDLATADSGIDR